MTFLCVMIDDDPNANTHLALDAVGRTVHDVTMRQARVFDREGRSLGWTLRADLEHVGGAYLPAEPGLEVLYGADADWEPFFIRTLPAIGWCVRDLHVRPLIALLAANAEIVGSSCWAARWPNRQSSATTR